MWPIRGLFVPATAMSAQFRMYFVRHGETEWNRMRRIQGQLDVPLNETGSKQATLVAEALKDIPFARAFSSDLQRASKVRTLGLTCGLPRWTDPFPDRRMYPPIPSGHRFGTRRIDPRTSKHSTIPSASSELILRTRSPCDRWRSSIWANCRGKSGDQRNQHHRWRRHPILLRDVWPGIRNRSWTT